MDDRLSVSILPTTLTVTHVSTMYIVNPTDDAANLHSQRIDRPLTNDAGQIGNSDSRKISEAQCGNFMIFLSLRIYMKSIFGIRYTSAKSAIFTNLEALDFDFYEFLHFLNYEIYQIIELQSPKNGKMAVLELTDSPKLISRKI